MPTVVSEVRHGRTIGKRAAPRVDCLPDVGAPRGGGRDGDGHAWRGKPVRRTALSAPDCAVFYVTDAGFAFPTLVSALAVREQAGPEITDIRIVLTNVSSDFAERLSDFLAPFAIQVNTMPSELYSNFDLASFNKTHVPRSSLGRFFMLECSPGTYEHVIYLDGDTWISGDITPLIKYRPPKGMIAAAEDPSYYYRNNLGENGKRTRSYFKGLGIDSSKGYFNAGVLSADKEAWNDISNNAFDFFANNTTACVYHDQSALNVAAQGRRVRLSPRWNFFDHYSYWDLEERIKPAIYHFAGGAKPWTGRFFPWQNIHDSYRGRIEQLAHLDLDIKTMSDDRAMQENATRRAYKKKIDTVLSFRKFTSRKDVLSLHAHSVLAG
jgi:lipopolysaccharide biosynthesis glycosyltransferase